MTSNKILSGGVFFEIPTSTEHFSQFLLPETIIQSAVCGLYNQKCMDLSNQDLLNSGQIPLNVASQSPQEIQAAKIKCGIDEGIYQTSFHSTNNLLTDLVFDRCSMIYESHMLDYCNYQTSLDRNLPETSRLFIENEFCDAYVAHSKYLDRSLSPYYSRNALAEDDHRVLYSDLCHFNNICKSNKQKSRNFRWSASNDEANIDDESQQGGLSAGFSQDDNSLHSSIIGSELHADNSNFNSNCKVKTLPVIDDHKFNFPEEACSNHARAMEFTSNKRAIKINSSKEEKLKAILSFFENDSQDLPQLQLWQFLLQLLGNPTSYSSSIHWVDRLHGEFCISDPEAVARQWGARKKRSCMNFDKMGRALRYYYEKMILHKIPGRKSTYKFNLVGLLCQAKKTLGNKFTEFTF